MSYPLGPRFLPASKAQSEKFIVYPPRQTYLMHTRLCQDIIDALVEDEEQQQQRNAAATTSNNTNNTNGTHLNDSFGGAMQGSISTNLQRRSKAAAASAMNEQSMMASSRIKNGPLGMSFLLSSGTASSSSANQQQRRRSPKGSKGPSQSQSGGGGVRLPRLPPAGSFALQCAAVGQINATIPYDASASDAIAAVFDQIGYNRRPVEDFVILQTFADFAPDFTTVPMYGDGQLVRLAMKFPYYALITISPYVRERDNLVERLEPVARAKIENERSAFRMFAHGYAQLLHQMARAYSSLYETELRTRMLKKVQERQHFFTVSLFQLLGNESKERYFLKNEERSAWERLMFLWDATTRHQRFADEQYAIFLQEREAMFRLFTRNAFEIELLKTLRARMAAIRQAIEVLLEEHCSVSRNIYTESRLVGNFLSSNAAGLYEKDFEILRHIAGRDRNPNMYPCRSTSNTNHLVINSDVFTCTRFAGAGSFPEMAIERELRQKTTTNDSQHA